MRVFLLLIVLATTATLSAQEKKLWAKSFLNKKAPELVIEKWITDKPDMDGKYVIIDFWATWCGPCKRAIPELNEFHEKFGDQLVVIGVSDEPTKKVKKMKKPEIHYYSGVDTKARTKRIYQVQGIPHCVLINPDGIVVWEGWPSQPGYELTEEVIADIIND